MIERSQRQLFRHTSSIVDTIMKFVAAEWQSWFETQKRPSYRIAPLLLDNAEFLPYPLDMWPELSLPSGTLDNAGVPYNRSTLKYPATYHPTTIAQYALAHWNAYLTTKDKEHQKAFITQAQWLVDHESRFADDMGGWPISFPVPDFYATAPWLSAMTQGEGISVLVRAYSLTNDTTFLQVARRAVHTFERDLSKGGVTATIDDGIFFEEVAVYPPAHILNGFLFALFGLYDYVELTKNVQIEVLTQRSHATLHTLLDKFDAGYWSHYDLLFKHIAPLFYHSLHVLQLKALARSTNCKHCAMLATRWEVYQHSPWSRIRCFISRRIARYRRGFRWLFLGDPRPRSPSYLQQNEPSDRNCNRT